MDSKSVLGKGLASLLGDTDIERVRSKALVKMCPVSKIVPKKDQPRRVFKEEAILELAQSIKEKGVLQPIIVEENNGYFEIIAGERRWRACKQIGMEEMPAIIKKIDSKEKLEVALIENLQREDINPVEEARAYLVLKEKYNLSPQEIADKIGKDRSTVVNSMRLLDLPEDVLKYVLSGKLTQGAARALLQIKDKKLLLIVAKKVIDESLSVRQIENLAKNAEESRKNSGVVKKKISPAIFSYVEQLKKRFQTMVKINNKKKGGNIIIDYYSDEDLERILSLLR